MKKTILVVIAVMALILGNSSQGLAYRGHGHGHGGGHFGVDLWLGPGWGAWGPYPYPYYQAPVIIEKEPDLYLEPQPRVQYWYFCPNPKGYYPYVKQCPDGWMKVVPTPTPAGPEEEE